MLFDGVEQRYDLLGDRLDLRKLAFGLLRLTGMLEIHDTVDDLM